ADLPTARITRSDTPPRAPQPLAGVSVPPAPCEALTGLQTMRFRYAAATAPFYQQTGRFRIVAEGPKEEQPAVLAALQNLKETK
ncbi:hypothetical protein ACC848_39950, partial [Rhizobium johnstonii]